MWIAWDYWFMTDGQGFLRIRHTPGKRYEPGNALFVVVPMQAGIGL